MNQYIYHNWIENKMKKRKFIKMLTATTMASITTKGIAGNLCSVSGVQSGNLSNVNNTVCNTFNQGKTVGYWIVPFNNWPIGVFRNDTFQVYFPLNLIFHIGEQTMVDTLGNVGLSQENFLAAQTVAMLLNAIEFGVSGIGYSESDVVSLYHTYHISDPQALIQTFSYINNGAM